MVLRFEYILLKMTQQMFCQVVTYQYLQVLMYFILPIFRLRAQSFTSQMEVLQLADALMEHFLE